MITPGQVTRFLRDYPDYNILLGDVQFDEEDILDAIKFAIEEFNAMAPITNFTDSNFPNDWLLLLGTAAHLMKSEAFLQLRNAATYSDGDVQNVGVDDKAPVYMNFVQALQADWKESAQRYKQQLNMEQGYGWLSSGYRYIYPGGRTRR